MALRATRTSSRASVTRLLNNAAALTEEASEQDIFVLLRGLEHKRDLLQEIEERCLADYAASVSNDPNIEALLEAEAEKKGDYEDRIAEVVATLQFKLEKARAPPAQSSAGSLASGGHRATPSPSQDGSTERQESGVSSVSRHGLRTHEFKLDTFDGADYLAYPGWRSEFESLIDDHPGLDNVSKLALLKRSLAGQAANLVSGLHCSQANYGEALRILDDVYGDANLLLGLFVSDLTELNASTNPNHAVYNDLVMRFDRDQREIRHIVAKLKSEVDLVSFFLAPNLLAKIPESIKMRWFAMHQSPEDRFNVDKLLNFLKTDLRDRRTSALLKSNDAKKSAPTAGERRHPRSTTSALISADKNTCIFCERKGHRLYNCRKFESSSAEKRTATIKYHELCFKCLEAGHYASACTAALKCKKCLGAHATSTCNQKNENAMAAPMSPPSILLQVVRVLMRTNKGKKRWCNALFDSASSCSWVRKDLASELELEEIKLEEHTVQTLSSTERMNLKKVAVNLRGVRGFDQSIKFEPWVFPGQGWNIHHDAVFPLPKEIAKLSDFRIYRYRHLHIDVVIGSDSAPRLLTGKTVGQEPTAVETKLGWVLWGSSEPQQTCLLSESLPTNVEALWDMETLGISETPAEKRSLQPPIKKEGRYEIRLPFIGDREPAANLLSAAKRQEKTEEKRPKEEAMAYEAKLKEMSEEGVIEPSPHPDNVGYLMPHRGIRQKGKLRIVFDASAMSPNKLSLNQCLDAGENLLLKIPKVLLKFREKKYAGVGDLKAAFHQIAVDPEDRKWLQFLHNGEKWQFARVPFGITSAPWLLMSTLHAHFDGMDPALGKLLKESFYCDDWVCSFDTQAERDAALAHAQVSLASAKMTLRIPSSDSVLGLDWDKEADTLAVAVDHLLGEPSGTKRGLLSDFSSIFDPLGILSPYTVVAKALFQRTWPLNLSWDSKIPAEMIDAWREWKNNPPRIKIPRWTGGSFNSRVILHLFADASSIATGVAAYVLNIATGESHLIMSKSRVLPLKAKLTIPQAELTAVCLATRIGELMREMFSTIARTVIWTDSTTALQWCKSEATKSVYVRNRVRSVRNYLRETPNSSLRHVCSELNAADLPSRGATGNSLDSKWLTGPDFIRKEAKDWHKSDETPLESEELIATLNTCLLSSTNSEEFKFSLDKESRVRAWIRRFAHNCRFKEKKRGPLSNNEIENAVDELARSAQEAAWEIDLENCNHDSSYQLSTFGLGKLRPVIDQKRRLVMMSPRNGAKPIPIIPHRSKFAEKLIEKIHENAYHAGHCSTLALSRKDFWITKGLSVAKRIIHACSKCRRFKATPFTATEGPLMPFRVTPRTPFSHVACDFTGPVYLEDSSKAWILILVCSSTRAPRLELCASPDAESTYHALRRTFAAHVPLFSKVEIFSDNAKCFVKCAKMKFKLHVAEWRFIPTRSPSWGGMYEIFCRLVKSCLKPTFHGLTLTADELSTSLAEIAAVVNSRPLTVVSTSAEDLQPLSPGDFVRGFAPPGDDFNPEKSPENWDSASTQAKEVWKRWEAEYLPRLATWHGKEAASTPPRPGDIILIHLPTPRGTWPLGRISKVIPGRDGVIRVCEVICNGKRSLRNVRLLTLLVRPDDGGDQPCIVPQNKRLLREDATTKEEPGASLATHPSPRRKSVRPDRLSYSIPGGPAQNRRHPRV